MFDRNDPRADALKAVHEGRVTVSAYDPTGRPHFYLDDDLVWKGHMAHLHNDGLIQVAEDGAVGLTGTGESMLIIACGIMPAPGVPDEEEDEDEDLPEDDDEDRDDSGLLPPAPRRGAEDSGLPLISYYGVDPRRIDFVNSPDFRSVLRRHRLELYREDEDDNRVPVSLSDPIAEQAYVTVVDPDTDETMYVLIDDESYVHPTCPGIIEVLRLVDAFWMKTQGQRAFIDEDRDSPEKGDPDWETEFDFTTGHYKEA